MTETYKNWFKNKEVIEDLKENIKKSGTPLELRTKKLLKDNNFHATYMRYSSENIWRELDIHAFRIENLEAEIEGCKVVIMTHIIGECKYSTDMDVFVFEHSDKENVDTKLFPIRINGHKILSQFINLSFKFPLVTEKAIHVNVDKRQTKNDGYYNDSKIHEACEQVLNATNFFCNREKESLFYEYSNFRRSSAIFSLWEEELKRVDIERERESGGIERIPNSFIEKFLQEKFNPKTMLKDFPYIIIHLVIPLIVFDENRGIIKASMDGNCNITNFEDVGYCLYPYISENANNYQNVLENHFNFPIILSTYSHLNKVLETIDKGIKDIIVEIQEELKEKPYLIPKEIIFNNDIRPFLKDDNQAKW